jgi:hypothetical protein
MNNNSCNIIVTKSQTSVHLEYYSIIQTTKLQLKCLFRIVWVPFQVTKKYKGVHQDYWRNTIIMKI